MPTSRDLPAPQQAFPDIIHMPLFRGVNHLELESLLHHGKIQYLPRRKHLFRQGDPVDYFYIVCSGSIQLLRETPDGRSHTSDIILKGKTLGKTEIFKSGGSRQQSSAIALEDSIIVWFPAEWLKNAARNQAVALNLLMSLSHYSRTLEIEAVHKRTMTASQQMACFLLRLGEVHGLDVHHFELPYSKALIASRLGIERETFSRCASSLKQHGIEVQDAKIVVHDSARVQRYICECCSAREDCTAHQKLAAKVLAVA